MEKSFGFNHSGNGVNVCVLVYEREKFRREG